MDTAELSDKPDESQGGGEEGMKEQTVVDQHPNQATQFFFIPRAVGS